MPNAEGSVWQMRLRRDRIGSAPDARRHRVCLGPDLDFYGHFHRRTGVNMIYTPFSNRFFEGRSRLYGGRSDPFKVPGHADML
jgi:hypothetical protein